MNIFTYWKKKEIDTTPLPQTYLHQYCGSINRIGRIMTKIFPENKRIYYCFCPFQWEKQNQIRKRSPQRKCEPQRLQIWNLKITALCCALSTWWVWRHGRSKDSWSNVYILLPHIRQEKPVPKGFQSGGMYHNQRWSEINNISWKHLVTSQGSSYYQYYI